MSTHFHVSGTGVTGPLAGLRSHYKWWVLVTAIFGAFVSILDTTIVNTALPQIQRAFGSDLHVASYVNTAYTLAQGVIIAASGFLANRFGIKRMYLLSLALFTLGSVLCGIAWNINILILFRVLQGAGGAALFPLSLSLIFGAFPEEQRGLANGIFGIPVLTAPALGPAIGGLLYAFYRGPSVVYATALAVGIISVLVSTRIEVTGKPRAREPFTLKTVFAGFHYIWNHKIVFGSISLDLFAVLLGGAVALLPVYAKEILRTGPWGLGLLRSMPGLGAAVMALLIAYRPIRKRAGATMLWCVGGFGLFTMIFGFSRSLPLSLLSLFFVGAADMVSVVVRGVLIQLGTPDEMRGRVNAVDMVFIGASNELGEFESGLAAQWLGAVPAVIWGGVGTVLITILWAWMFPQLRNADKLSQKQSADAVAMEEPAQS